MRALLTHRIVAFWHDLRGNKDKSLEHHKAILQRDPVDIAALSAVVSELRRSRRHLEALEVVRRALDVDSDDYLALRYAACLAVRLGLYDEAKDYAERSLEVAPEMDAKPRMLMQMADKSYLIAQSLGRVLRRRGAFNSPQDAPSSQASQYIDDHKEWALQYFEWYAKTVAGPSTPIWSGGRHRTNNSSRRGPSRSTDDRAR